MWMCSSAVPGRLSQPCENCGRGATARSKKPWIASFISAVAGMGVQIAVKFEGTRYENHPGDLAGLGRTGGSDGCGADDRCGCRDAAS